jgi:hypothetical protein
VKTTTTTTMMISSSSSSSSSFSPSISFQCLRRSHRTRSCDITTRRRRSYRNAIGFPISEKSAFVLAAALSGAEDDGAKKESFTMKTPPPPTFTEIAQTGEKGELSSGTIQVYPLAKPRIPIKVATEGEQINSMKELTAKAIIGEVLRMSWRDFLPTVTLVFVAGFFAQALNLGGTFFLALIQVHEVEVVAATFVVAVQAWKFLCQFLVRIATFKNAYIGDKEQDGTIEKENDNMDDKYGKIKPKYAYGVLKQGLALYKSILVIDLRRTLSIAWNGIITIPIPYLGIMRCLDLALCVPVRIFEGKQGGENLKRSTELMLGRKILLLKTFFYLSAIASSVVGLIIGLFALLVPSLATILLPPVGADPASLGGAAQGLVTGTAFERVWDVGTVTERSATILLLMIAVMLSFFFTLGFRQLIYVFHREVANRWTPPPPPPPRKLPEWAKKLKKKVQFWKKDDEKGK